MHDLNLRLFYKTTFDVACVEKGKDALWGVLLDIKYWIGGKWERRGVEIPGSNSVWSAFKRGGLIKSTDADHRVKLESKAYLHGDATDWACQITEIEDDGVHAPREWVCEIGFADDGHGAGTLSLVLSWGDEPGWFRPCLPEPVATIPGVVRKIATDKHLSCTVDGVAVDMNAKELLEGDVAFIRDLILDETRDTPVVFAGPRKTEDGEIGFGVSPDTLARTLGPSAPVYYTKNMAVLTRLNKALGLKKWDAKAGGVRVYMGRPKPGSASDHVRHRYFTAEQIDELGEDEVLAILRRTLAADVNFYETMTRIPDIERRIKRAANDKRARALEAERDSMAATNEKLQEEALELAADIEEELALVSDELEGYKTRAQELTEENYTLSAKVDWLSPFADTARRADATSNGLDPWPLSAAQVADAYLAAYADRLDFTERGRKTLADCSTAADILWNAFYDLVEIAHPLFEAGPGTDVARAFNDRSKFEYARGAGMMTRKNNDMMANYKDVYEGRELDVQPHLKSGVKESDPKFLRLYFAYDDASGKIVVSHVGRHLDTYGTRQMK